MMKLSALHQLYPIMTEDGIRYRHPLAPWILMSEGVKGVAASCRACWLIDLIVFAQDCVIEVDGEPTQKWCLEVAPDHSALLTCSNLEKRTLISHRIPFTDFPHPKITLWLMDDVILLPWECL